MANAGSDGGSRDGSASGDSAASGSVVFLASLTGQGRLLLGGQYNVGEALSPVRLTFPPHTR
ncbi:hypothetical protein [Arthrobacter sp. UYEF21]|uniref:hypothetical protein n=1 Tax=Arthrobacter sp. UYEF21 TaxID=1756364 RepID=UPI0033936990